jgi:hypothetical protein
VIAIAYIALSFYPDDLHMSWHADWAWGCPLIVLTVIIHVLGLGYLIQRVIDIYSDKIKLRYPRIAFAIVIGASTLLATFLHAIETGIWAIAYCWIGAIRDFKSAMLYSLGAMTTYGNEGIPMAYHWRMLGEIEALNGWLLFGLSTAFLFWLIQQVTPNINNRATH